MNRKTIAAFVAWGVFGLSGFAARPAFAEGTCTADTDCTAGTSCVAISATGCVDSCANNGGCVDVPCDHYVKACVATCVQDSDCKGGTYCQPSVTTLTCPSAGGGAGGTPGSSNQGCVESFSIGQCMYHALGSIPDGQAGSVNTGDSTSAAGAPNEESDSEQGGSAGQESGVTKTEDAAPSAASSPSGGCAVAFGASNFGSVGLLLFGLGVVLVRRRRRS